MNKWGFLGTLGMVFLVTLKFSYGPGYGGELFALLGLDAPVLSKTSPRDMVTQEVTPKNMVTFPNVTTLSPIMSPVTNTNKLTYYQSPKMSLPPSSSNMLTPSPRVTLHIYPSTVPSPTNSTKININTATLIELDRISEVGPVIAQRIVDYRAANGPFQKIEDIKKVQGIGDKNFEKMKDEITVEP
jgi:competence ComEA-like helix-hairpin-helix protein